MIFHHFTPPDSGSTLDADLLICPEGSMAQSSNLGSLILDKIKDLKEDFKDLRDDVKDTKELIDRVKEDLGGHNGIRERLTALESQVKQVIDQCPNSGSSYPPPRKKSIKDHAPAAGFATAAVVLAEVIAQFVKK